MLDFQTFEFVSVGTKGCVTKVVRYLEIHIKRFYKLGFGDKGILINELNGRLITQINNTLLTI